MSSFTTLTKKTKPGELFSERRVKSYRRSRALLLPIIAGKYKSVKPYIINSLLRVNIPNDYLLLLQTGQNNITSYTECAGESPAFTFARNKK